jgi:hypothetical protein
MRIVVESGVASTHSWQFTTVEELEIVEPPVPNNWGWIGIIFLVTVIALLLLYLFNKERKGPDNIEEEPIAKERGPPDV